MLQSKLRARNQSFSRLDKVQALTLLVGILVVDLTHATSCSAGLYFKDEIYCAVCERGSYCPGGDPALQLSCTTGEFSGFGASSCTNCPAGWYCTAPSALPIPCNPGEYTNAGATSCTTCTDGYNCKTDGTLETCAPGDVCDASNAYSSIFKCPAGYTCGDYTLTLGSGQMEACSAGSYSLEGSSHCTVCPQGSYCLTTTDIPTACPSGKINLSFGSTSLADCTDCPAGYSCSSTSVPATACQPGTYSFAGSSSCSNCPAGAACGDPTQEPSPCVDGTYSTGTATACAACAAGKSCTQSTTADCSAGFYSTQGQMDCIACPPGFDCTSKDEAVPCAFGYTSSGGSATCTICPLGSKCPLPSASPVVCPMGTFTDKTGQIECLDCPDGYTCLQDGTITRCSEGQMTDQYHQTCRDCPAGYACPGRQIELIRPCESGQFSLAATEYCTTAKAGWYAQRTDLTQVECSDGYWSEGATTYCNKCMPGWQCADKTGRHNQVCWAGQYSKEDGTCVDCDASYFCPTAHGGYKTANGVLQCSGSDNILYSAAAAVECSIVPVGSYWDSANTATAVCTNLNTYSDGKNRCEPCPSNHECAFGKTMSHCPAFFYAPDTTGDCQFCPDGQDCRQISTSPVDCTSGYYSQSLDLVCVPCPKGYYCPNTNNAVPTICAPHTYSGFYAQASCDACPTGFYAPAGSDSCIPTPPGFKRNGSATSADITSTSVLTACADGEYSDWGEDSCTTCPKGFLCPPGTGDATPWPYSCPRGSYCASGLETKCSAGFYNQVERAYDSTFCVECPQGYYCEEGAEHFSYYPCPLGHYCSKSATIPTACPQGSYNDELYGASAGDCKTCPMGHECAEAQTDRGAVCQEGYYCPIGSYPIELPCPKGTFGGYRTGKYDLGQCLQCPAGSFCGSATATPTPAAVGYYSPLTGLGDIEAFFKCPPGFYCPNTGMTTYLGYWCSKGHYCPAGSSSATGNPCPAGTYTDQQDLFDPEQCTPCPRGYKCAAGAYTGANMALCDQNQYCPFGTADTDNIMCPTGTYAPFTGSYSLDDCLPCPPGSYCAAGAAAMTCPNGYYCPEGTISATEHPCPVGYFNDGTGLIDETQCKHCQVGNYCNAYGLTAISGQCAPGTYNNYTTTAEFCINCPAGFICTSTGTVQPQKCPKGQYSVEGAIACQYCPAGHYCPYSGISEEQMQNLVCPEGTLCIASTQQTINSVLTDVGLDVYPNNDDHSCPQYKYCPRGATVSLDIPLGTTQLLVARGSLQDAIELPAGMYQKEQTLCTIGNYCPAGSSAVVPCPKGTFRNDLQGMDTTDCGKCPAGTYCPSEGMDTPTSCPMGSFCPEGSQKHQLCPAGTYNPNLGATDSRDCTACDAGRYCPYMGQIAVDNVNNQCDAGYFCRAGASRPEPTDGITGNECPQGRYCPQGTTTEVPCSAGQFNAVLHATSSSDCINCWAGYYCPGTSSSGPFNQCPETYYCPAGTATFTLQPVAGEYAPAFQSEPLNCARGTYSTAGLAACLTCPAGKFCDSIGLAYDPGNSIELPACPNGYYCPSYLTLQTNSLSYDKQPCPFGTYYDQTGAKAESECIDCPAGQYCDEKALIAAPTTNFCEPGYWCALGAETPYPDTTRNGYYGPCPAGSYCEQNCINPTPCVAGTYSNQERATSADFCLPCPPGQLCQGTGNTTPSDDCAAGTYCTDGQNQATTTEGYAPIGSSHQMVCPPGFYQQDAGKGFCNQCSAGSYCIDNRITACPEGRYCP